MENAYGSEFFDDFFSFLDLIAQVNLTIVIFNFNV